MKARVAHEYSELDKRHCYYCDNTHFWVWFGIGQKVPDEINIYPYIPTWKPTKGRTFSSRNAHELGLKCGEHLMKYFNKYGK